MQEGGPAAVLSHIVRLVVGHRQLWGQGPR